MEKEWPPLRTCPQYKSGLIRRLVDGKYSWEEEGNEGDWFDLCKRHGIVDPKKMRNKFLMAKKFLHQVRTTRGYGVTCHLPLHNLSFANLTKSEWNGDECVKEAIHSTLTHIYQKTGEAYEVVKIKNVVDVSLSLMYLLTFVAKKPNSVPETFLSMVCQMPGDEEVMECILKPDGEADWGANEDKVLFAKDF